MSRTKKCLKNKRASFKKPLNEARKQHDARLQLHRLREVADRYKVTRHPDLAIRFRVLVDALQASMTMTDIIMSPKLHQRQLEALETMALN